MYTERIKTSISYLAEGTVSKAGYPGLGARLAARPGAAGQHHRGGYQLLADDAQQVRGHWPSVRDGGHVQSEKITLTQWYDGGLTFGYIDMQKCIHDNKIISDESLYYIDN